MTQRFDRQSDTWFPPATLRQYAVLADGERGALVGPHGDIGFLCVPRWHDDAVFARLLGGPGVYAVRPQDHHYVWGGHYEHGSLIWRSRWVTGSRITECREALVFPGDQRRAVLLRRIEPQLGDAHVRVTLNCRAGFGAEEMRLRPVGDDGCWEGTSGDLQVRWTGVPTSEVQETEDGSLSFDLTVPDGGRHDLVLEIGTSLADAPPEPNRAWAETQRAWEERVPEQMESLAPRDARHALAVLHGMTSSTGGMVAAATTSLPERAEGGLDYDYRYTWIRDQSFAAQAAAACGDTRLLGMHASFITERLLADGDRLRPAYTMTGGRVPPSQPLDLDGYPGAPDVGSGNRAGEQYQLDAFGESLMMLAAADGLDVLDEDGHKAAAIAAQAIADHHREPDAGIWELSPKRWAHSRLICSAGLRAYAKNLAPSPEEWLRLADRLVQDTARESLHHSGRWQRAPEDPRVDAALLLPALRGGVPATDPRSVATWRGVTDDLTEDGYVYRFRHEQGELSQGEGAFLLCGFLLAWSSYQQDDPIGAVRYFERTRAAVGPPGLFTEEFDVVQRQLRGNIPQAFVHAELLETAHRLAGI